MLSIKVLGPGCRNCNRLEVHAIEAAEMFGQNNPDAEIAIEKVTDTEKFIDYGLLKTPGLVINEKLVSAGRIPTPTQILEWLQAESG